MVAGADARIHPTAQKDTQQQTNKHTLISIEKTST
jgi:hypothetical protein